MILALFAAVAILVPLLMLRNRALWRCLGCELAALLVFGALAAFARVLRVSVDPYLAMVAAGAVVLTIVCAFIALAAEVRWSANRAALLALLFYILMIPLLLRTPSWNCGLESRAPQTWRSLVPSSGTSAAGCSRSPAIRW